MRPIILLRDESTGKYIDVTRGNLCRLTQLEGTGEPDAAISTSKFAGTDGSYINSAYIEKRNLVFEMKFFSPQVEKARLAMYDVIQTRRNIRVYYATKNVNVYADGIVETFQVDNFKDEETTGQISVICSDPFWHSNATHRATANSIVDMFHFPFAIDEAGVPFSAWSETSTVEVSTAGEEAGLTIILRFSGTIKNPYIHCEETGELMTVNGTFAAGDTLTITTGKMDKKIQVRHSDTTKESKLSDLKDGSTWLLLQKGTRHYTAGAESGGGNMDLIIEWQDLYLGV